MSTIDLLASSLGRDDEAANLDLASRLAAGDDKGAIAELIAALDTGTAANIRHDAIKTLYEIGAIKPELIAAYAQKFAALLDDASNRMVWGAMTALDAIADVAPKAVEPLVPVMIKAADSGTVIAKDQCIMALVKLSRAGDADKMCPILLDRLQESAPNQFPLYAEQIAPVVPQSLLGKFTGILKARLETIAEDSKRRRVQKLLAKFNG